MYLERGEKVDGLLGNEGLAGPRRPLDGRADRLEGAGRGNGAVARTGERHTSMEQALQGVEVGQIAGGNALEKEVAVPVEEARLGDDGDAKASELAGGVGRAYRGVLDAMSAGSNSLGAERREGGQGCLDRGASNGVDRYLPPLCVHLGYGGSQLVG
ncbi:MAG: hypothetical protein Q8S13_04340 [Dehalococcoidia bacterium]|nr:hypothetical protein [Dehalococcoidia bacterium]